jgi:uncharacterized protein (DUF433 family)
MCGGRPYVAGKGISVQHIAALYNMGWMVQDFIEAFELTPGQIHAALSYYFGHQNEIDQDIEDTTKLVQQVGLSANELRRRIAARRK